ncbi:hypothetical protein B0H14DRAFT_2579575 [Mycena olivaceomarginata]|nr:hypothetical protein B0H14DRAFT_2579575 [Mycena olivaceomarginata]
MPALVNTTNFDHHTRRLDVSCNMAAGPSCQASPRSPQFYDDIGRRGSFDEDDDEDEVALAKKRECAKRVAAWITQSAVRITAITSPYIPSNTSFDMLDFDLDLDLEDESEPEPLYDSDVRYMPEGEPYLLYSSSSKSVGAPVIHAPTPRRSSRSRRPPPPQPLTPASDALAASAYHLYQKAILYSLTSHYLIFLGTVILLFEHVSSFLLSFCGAIDLSWRRELRRDIIVRRGQFGISSFAGASLLNRAWRSLARGSHRPCRIPSGNSEKPENLNPEKRIEGLHSPKPLAPRNTQRKQATNGGNFKE